MKDRMSFFVTRPPRPVPETWFGSTLCSAAMRATTGEMNAAPLPLLSVAADWMATGCGVSADEGASAS